MNLAGQRDVIWCDCTHTVGLQLHSHMGVPDRQIGMVPGSFGEVSDRVDEHDCVREARRRVLPPQPTIMYIPTGQIL